MYKIKEQIKNVNFPTDCTIVVYDTVYATADEVFAALSELRTKSARNFDYAAYSTVKEAKMAIRELGSKYGVVDLEATGDELGCVWCECGHMLSSDGFHFTSCPLCDCDEENKKRAAGIGRVTPVFIVFDRFYSTNKETFNALSITRNIDDCFKHFDWCTYPTYEDAVRARDMSKYETVFDLKDAVVDTVNCLWCESAEMMFEDRIHFTFCISM